MEKKRILITGGSGFIGTNISLSFCDIKTVSFLNIDKKEPLIQKLKPFFKLVDITNYNLFREIVLAFSPDYIIHLAARTDLDGLSLADYSANIIGVENLMKIVCELPNLKKVIITSSMLVCHAGYYPLSQFDYAPLTLYGESKVETEKIVWNNKPHCDWAIIRPTSIWGPWFGIPYRTFFDMILSRKYFHIGDKGCTKTYGYIGNSVYQIQQILFNETFSEKRKIFYIGDFPATNIKEWGDEISNELGFKIMKMPYWVIKCAAYCGDLLKIVSVEFPMTSFRLKNMTTNNIIDLSDTYGIAPNPPYTRIDGIKRTLRWMKEIKR